jgi:hypothetical protein
MSGVTDDDLDRIRKYLAKPSHTRRPDDLVPREEDEESDGQ